MIVNWKYCKENDKEQHILINNNKKNNKFVIISLLEDICNKQLSFKKLLLRRMSLSHIDVFFPAACVTESLTSFLCDCIHQA